MFKRITINSVETSKVARIAFTLLVPEKWEVVEGDEAVVAQPRWRRTEGFSVLMPHVEATGPAAALGTGTRAQVDAFVTAALPNVEPQAWDDDEEALSALDFACYRGRVEDVPGRVAALAAVLQVEDVNFVLIGVCRDEIFHRLRPVFRTMISSFQPIVTGLR